MDNCDRTPTDFSHKTQWLKVFSSVLLLVLGLLSQSAQAQVQADGTVNTIVSPMNNSFTITGGTTTGTNLFHSFSEFSVPTGGEAFFDNATTISTIFSRVTGGHVSHIDGLMRANGTASLFLINPAGIVFGENASLSLGGSFLGTTAESVVFRDGFEFSAIETNPSKLLVVSAPIGLQLGANSRDISVNGTGHQLTGDTNNTPIVNQDPSLVGLQVSSGQSLILMGRNITLEGGILTASSGHIELSGIGNLTSPLRIGLQLTGGRWHLDYSHQQPLGNINLSQQAFVNASGTAQGSIQIWGGNLTLQDGSIALIENSGDQAAGGINLNIVDTLNLSNAVPETRLSSGIYSDVSGSGTGSNITVQTDRIILNEGGNLQSRIFGSGKAGQVIINANNIEFTDSQADGIVGVIGSRSLGASGDSNNVIVNANQIHINGGGGITTTNFFGSGNSGNVIINARDSIELSVFPGNNNDAIIGASAVSEVGNAGNVTINTSRLLLEGGALISSSTFGSGRGGTITINATERVALSGGRFSIGRATQEGSTIRTAGVLLPSTVREIVGLPEQVTGAAGDIVINTPKLDLVDGGEIAVRHDSLGDAGNIQITANSITLANQGQVTANTTLGDGGNIITTSQNLSLDRSSITATTAGGNGGNLNIQVGDLLSLRQQSLISTTAGQAGTGGDGGNINLSAALIAGFPNENSDITANAFEGSGGNIQVSTDGLFGITFRRTPTSTSDITASSEFGVDGVVDIETPDIDPQQGLVPLPSTLVNVSNRIAETCEATAGQNAFTAIGRAGLPSDPRQPLQARLIWQDPRSLATEQGHLPVLPTTQLSRSTTKFPWTEAQGWYRNQQGQLHLVTQLDTEHLQEVMACWYHSRR